MTDYSLKKAFTSFADIQKASVASGDQEETKRPAPAIQAVRKKYVQNPNMRETLELSGSAFGARNWGKYEKPLSFGIVVNSMADVAKHRDRTFVKRDDISIASCSCAPGFRLKF